MGGRSLRSPNGPCYPASLPSRRIGCGADARMSIHWRLPVHHEGRPRKTIPGAPTFAPLDIAVEVDICPAFPSKNQNPVILDARRRLSDRLGKQICVAAAHSYCKRAKLVPCALRMESTCRSNSIRQVWIAETG